MSEYDKSQNFNVYDYNVGTRPEPGPDYAAFAAHPTYTGGYVGTQSQVPSGLPQSATAFNPITPAQQYGPGHTPYYAQQHVQYPGYVDPAPAARTLPEIVSYTPNQGQAGTKVTVYFRSTYDFDVPRVTPVMMFGQKRCESVLNKTAQQGQAFQYSLIANAPPMSPTVTASSQIPLSIAFDDGVVNWEAPSLAFGTFTYTDPTNYYPLEPSAPLESKKRKLSPEASPRRSPTKKPSLQSIAGAAAPTTPLSHFRRPSIADAYSQRRRFSGPDFQQSYNPGLRSVQSQQFYPSGQTTSALAAGQSPTWTPQAHPGSTRRSPSVAGMATSSRASSVLPSPNVNPPLIRTSTLQQSPPTPGAPPTTTQPFNPYLQYPANSKAVLKIEGDLNTMTQKWTNDEWDAGRRLVQFRRSQGGSVINATFEAVTLEDRIPNSICVSCIWWAEREECYVTSVDTISLLESLVAVRFTVEEKNRIRRNLEGFRPATVSKTKSDSEEFFKLIMGFPNPKPRNIEKDVKVFPWRILATALKKIIGKYSASYSSTAGALHTPGPAGSSYGGPRGSDGGLEQQQRPAASPLSTSSSTTSHGHAYAPNVNPYATHPAASAGLPMGAGIAPLAGPPLAVPASATSQATSWHQPSTHYSTDLSASARGAWDYGGAYLHPSPAIGGGMSTSTPGGTVGLPSSAAASYAQYAQHAPSLTSHAALSSAARFVPLPSYEEQSQQTSNA